MELNHKRKVKITVISPPNFIELTFIFDQKMLEKLSGNEFLND